MNVISITTTNKTCGDWVEIKPDSHRDIEWEMRKFNILSQPYLNDHETILERRSNAKEKSSGGLQDFREAV